MHNGTRTSRSGICLAVILLLLTASAWAQPAASGQGQWFKGNTHAHSWFSDGDSPPEMVIEWYRSHGYHFLVMSDHNSVNETERWVQPGKKAKPKTIAAYETTYGPDWVDKRERDGATEYRLRSIGALCRKFDLPGKFLVVPGEEISDSVANRPVHLNGLHLVETIRPQGGKTVGQSVRNNIRAVLAQGEKAGRPVLVHVNHPNFGWALTAEDLAPIPQLRFLEVQNGHGGVRNDGDKEHVSVERMWDIILSQRLGALRLPVVFGLATDDMHVLDPQASGAPPGRGWIMVRAAALTPADLLAAMERGDFYSSTGVTLNHVRFENDTLAIDIEARPGVEYKTQFIGTLKDYDTTVTPQKDEKGNPVTGKYSDDIGKILAEQDGPRASYKLTGRELYVRARVISTAKHPNPPAAGDVERAWTQPVRPASRG